MASRATAGATAGATTAAAGFLRPSPAEQARLRGLVEERARAKKAKAKVDAATRKRAREVEAARVAAIEQASAEAKTARDAAAARAKLAPGERECDDVCRAYLDRPVMLGRSEFGDMGLVKELCGAPGERVFDRPAKMWGTTRVGRIPGLLRSMLWHPFGVPPEWYDRLGALAVEVAAARGEVDEAAAAAAREAEAEAAAAARSAVSPAEAARVAAARERAERAARLRAWYQAPTAEERRVVQRLGLDDEALVEKTQDLMELGPLMGISAEARILRWVEAEVEGARCKHERDARRYWDAAFMRDVVEAKARADAVARIRRAAMRGGVAM